MNHCMLDTTVELTDSAEWPSTAADRSTFLIEGNATRKSATINSAAAETNSV